MWSRRTGEIVLGVAMASAMAEGAAVAGTLRPVTLHCEYRTNPMGLETVQPRLNWRLESGERGAMQSAYQVLVAENEQDLKANRGSLWDSGKVESEQSVHVVYVGKPLASRQQAWWKVRVWDKNGKESDWSAVNRWEMGLLNHSDWQGQWIGLPPEVVPMSRGAHNGYHSAFARSADTEKWVQIDLGGVREFDAVQLFPARPFDYARDIPGCFFPVRFRVEVANSDDFQGAKTVVDKTAEDVPNPAVTAPVYHFTSVTARYIRLAATKLQEREPGQFALALAEVEVLHGAQNIALHAAATAADTQEVSHWSTKNLTDGDTLSHTDNDISPAGYLRKTFPVIGKIKSARVYSSALGLYELSVNGKRVGEDIFTPGWTDYKKRVQYQVYDVTHLLKSGENALGMMIGDGWYCGHVGLTGKGNYGTAPRALAQLEIETEDGKKTVIATDSTWYAATGPIAANDLLMGETYDARKEIPGWDTIAFAARDWKPALSEPLTALPIVATPCDSAQKVMELKPKTVTAKNGPAYIFDMAQNMVGHVRLKVSGSAGTKIRLRFGEMLNPDGTLYTANLRGAKATDYYTLKGGGTETYEPRFTFHGFRYVELTGFPGKPALAAVTGVVVSSVVRQTGTFECSSPMVNKLQSNILWGQRGNYLEVPTDCPQRDERLGWMGDAQIFARTACVNFDVASFLTKFTQDMEDAQSAEGGYSDVSPRIGDLSDGAPAWADAGIIVPWTVYLCYGDTRLLERHYESMTKWIHYVDAANPDHLWRKRGNNNFGDWLNIGDDTPRDVIGTAYFAHSTRILAKVARILGKTEDAEKYEKLVADIKAAFNDAYVTPDGKIKGESQTCYVLALHFDLLPEDLRPLAAQHLTTNIMEKAKGHLATGFVGVGYLNPTLTTVGQKDVAYKLLNNDTFPSWGYSIKHGATTIWERWDGWTEEKGFQDVGMNSFNHYSLGSVGEWLFHTVAGIDLDPENPGYKHILLHPVPGGGLTYVKASYDSIYGKIVSDWKREKTSLVWNVTIPANTTATVTIPTADGAKVLEGGRPVTQAKGITFLRNTKEGAVFTVGSGAYRFTAPQ